MTMEILSNNFFAAAIIVLCNVFHGDRSKPSYETVTASFYWAALVFFMIWVFGFADRAFDVAILCSIAALSRDYEKLLKRIFNKS